MKQESPRTGSVIFLLERTLRRMRHDLNVHLRAEGTDVSFEQWIILKQAANGIPQHDIASRTAKDPASVTRIVSLLEKKKMVQRIPDKKDKRRVIVRLTPKGKLMMKKADTAVNNYRKKGLKGINDGELPVLKKTLDKLFENAGGVL